MRGSARQSGPFLVSLGLALLLVVVPGAHAAPVEAELDSPSFVLDGRVHWTGITSLVELEALDGVPSYTLSLAADRAVVHVQTEAFSQIETPVFDASPQPETTYNEETLTDVRLDGVTAGADLKLVLDGRGDGFQARAEAPGGTISAIRSAFTHVNPRLPPSVETAYSVEVHEQIRFTPPRVNMSGTGDVTLSFWDATLDLKTAEGDRSYRGGAEADPARPSAGPLAFYRQTLIWIELEGAIIDLHWQAPAALVAPTPTIALDGTVEADGARGILAIDGTALRPRDEPLSLTGALTLRPFVPPNAHPPDQIRAVMPYDRTGSNVEGDADALTLSGAVVVRGKDDRALLVAAGAGVGLLGMAAAAWRFGPLAVATLYSRLETGNLLRNPTRAQIYEIIKHNPGISARQVHRLADASWGTVVHHLGKLADGGFIVAKSNGRAKCYYENHGKWDGYQETLAVLAGVKTRAVAEAMVAVPGRDQGQIIGRTGLPQSTVSYHLLKLERAGLASKERIGTMWAYYPTPKLRDALVRTGQAAMEAS